MIGLLVLVIAAPGCIINRLRAKDNLNEGVREFNKGRYELAQEKFQRALDLSPDLTNAQLFYARALNARFDQSLTEDLGLKTIEAYDNIIQSNPENHEMVDQALALKANVYDQLTRVNHEKAEEFKEKQRDMLLKRAELPAASEKTKADVYYTLGVSYWKESYDLGYPYVNKKQPIPPAVQEKMRPRIRQAHEYLQKTVAVQPDYANAFFYEKLVYMEDTKVESNDARLKELYTKINELQDKYLQLQKQQQQQASQG
jgi:tetratricopeptide (TPR) repeat protein